MLTSVKEILTKAKKGKYAVGAFNTVNMEFTQAILEAAAEKKSPVIIQITEKTLNYAGGRNIFHMVKNIAEFYYPEIPFGIHLDHGKNMAVIQRAIKIGFPSVMYDASRKPYEDNLEETKRVVELAHQHQISVQAELGNVPNFGELDMNNIDWDKYMTDPEQAQDFVEKTGIDTLAIGIGNAHSFTKERSEPDYQRLERINDLVKVPLILHGASDWEGERAKKVIEKGISCFNIDTASRVAFIDQLRKTINSSKQTPYDVRATLGTAREAVKKRVKAKIELFGSTNKI